MSRTGHGKNCPVSAPLRRACRMLPGSLYQTESATVKHTIIYLGCKYTFAEFLSLFSCQWHALGVAR